MLLAKLDETVDFIQSKIELRPRLAITLGSGLAAFVEAVDVEAEWPYSEIPHFAPPTVEGHPGKLVIGKVKDVPVAILQGRIHFYEGHAIEQVVFPTRVLGRMGVKALVLTNAAGGLDPRMSPGDFMIISDHINLTGTNPLIGPNIAELGPRFLDLSRAWDPELNIKLEKIMAARGLSFSVGVYCGVAGPSYESAAEVRFLRTIGGAAVGMSTVPEALAAHHMGVKICGISCITNLATGITDQKITHDEVKEIAQRVEKDFCGILQEFIHQMGQP